MARLDDEIVMAMAALDTGAPPGATPPLRPTPQPDVPDPSDVLAAKALARGKLMIALSLAKPDDEIVAAIVALGPLVRDVRR